MARLFLLLLLALQLPAQTTSPFQLAYQGPTDTVALPLSSGGNIPFPLTAVGGSSSVSLFLSNRSTTAYQITEGAAAGTGFAGQVRNVPVNPNSSVTLIISFSPRVSGLATGSYTLQLSGGGQASTLTFTLTASAGSAEIVTSYALSATGNQTPVASGGTIPFGASALGLRNNATFVIANRGTIAADVQSVTLSGAGFELSNLPLLPARLAAGQELRFTLVFAPLALNTYAGSLRILFGDETRTFSLTGQGTGASFAYDLIRGDTAARIQPEDTISFPSTVITTGRTSIQLRVTNEGTSEGRLTTLSISGTSFLLENTPLLPVTLAAGESAVFNVTFSPRDTGNLTGRLRVENAGFNLAGTGLGARLSLTMIVADQRISVGAGPVTVPNTPVGGRQNFDIEIANSGNAPANISTINFVAANSGLTPFSILRLPALPAQLAPGDTLVFSGSFAPTALGTSSATLQVEDLAIVFRGNGNPPPALPAVLFPNLPDRLEPLDLPGAAIRLERAYPYEVTGRLTISFVSDVFADDPAIQFATGSKTVDFRIPANSTDAVFSSGSQTIRFQSGTTAGAITLAATFAVAGLDLSPAGGATRTMTIAQSAPTIRSIVLGTRSANSFELLISGFSTSRSITQLSFEFEPAPGAILQTSRLTANVDSVFSSWFQSLSSRPYGSQFTIAIRFDLTGDGSAVQSLKLTATNGRGVSEPKTFNFLAN